jgi:hypothetical protein
MAQRALLLIDISSDSNHLYTVIQRGLEDLRVNNCLGDIPLPIEWVDLENIHDYCFMRAFEEVFAVSVIHYQMTPDVLRLFYDQYVKNSAVSICYRLMDTYKLYHLKNQRHVKLLITPAELIISYIPHP